MRQTIQVIVTARGNGYIILGLSILCIMASVAIFAVGTIQMEEIDVEEESIFAGRSGDVDVQEYATYSVFVTSEYTCDEAEVSITEEVGEEVWDYFFKDCDGVFDEEGWTYIGYFSTDFDGSLSVEANRQVRIIDDTAYFDEGGAAIIASTTICCLGIIGSIISVMILITAKDKVDSLRTDQGVVFLEPGPTPEEEPHVMDEGESEWWKEG